MIVYRSNKSGFQSDVDKGQIDLVIGKAFKEKLNRKTSEKEVESWWNSLHFMYSILNDKDIPNNTGVAIECQIPQTSKRIDFILTGKDEGNKDNVVIVELKQWKSSQITEKDGIVKTALGKGLQRYERMLYLGRG